jgi:ADP-ribose pyrophosphatase YjhB (NUDIX family)
MGKNTMQPARARLLAELLREMREGSKDYFPEEAWYEIHRCFAIPYVEVVIVERDVVGPGRVYLVRRERDDPHWPGEPWHVPGGIWRVSQTLEEACQAVAARELDVGVSVHFEVMTLKWKDHAYANPISHVCVCEAERTPLKSERARFFAHDELPSNMLIHHRDFVEASFAALKLRSLERS